MEWDITSTSAHYWSIMCNGHNHTLRCNGGEWFVDYKWISRTKDPKQALLRAMRYIEKAHKDT